MFKKNYKYSYHFYAEHRRLDGSAVISNTSGILCKEKTPIKSEDYSSLIEEIRKGCGLNPDDLKSCETIVKSLTFLHKY